MDTLLKIIAFSCFCGAAFAADGDPTTWAQTYPTCSYVNNPRQSPIDIKAFSFDSALKDLQYKNYGTANSQTTYALLNTGSTAKISFTYNGGNEMKVYDSRHGWFKAAQLHFHWGDQTAHLGGEHLFDGKQYPAELHIVHVNEKYADINAAINQADGLLVLGTIIERGAANSAYDAITNSVNDIMYKDNTTNITPFALQTLLPKDYTSKYYTYDGGLTTPPCSGSVQWILFKNHVSLSNAQLAKFYSMHSGTTAGSTIINYYRPVQPLGDRKVTATFYPSSAPAFSACFTTLSLLLAAVFLS